MRHSKLKKFLKISIPALLVSFISTSYTGNAFGMEENEELHMQREAYTKYNNMGVGSRGWSWK